MKPGAYGLSTMYDIGTYLLAGSQHQLPVAMQRLAAGKRLVIRLWLVAGQKLVRYVESGFMDKIYWTQKETQHEVLHWFPEQPLDIFSQFFTTWKSN